MEWTEIRGHVEEKIKDYRPLNPWKKVEANVWRAGNGKIVFVYLFGTTPDDHMFRVEFYLNSPEDFNKSYIECATTNALSTLDTFMDKECTCTPSKGCIIGEHCGYHKKLFGF